MNKMVLFFLGGLALLFLGGLVAGFHVFEPWERLLAEPVSVTPAPDTIPQEMSWKGYRKVKLAFGSFDLANGLTKNDLETMSQGSQAFGFYFLLACLGLCIGLRALPPRR